MCHQIYIILGSVFCFAEGCSKRKKTEYGEINRFSSRHLSLFASSMKWLTVGRCCVRCTHACSINSWGLLTNVMHGAYNCDWIICLAFDVVIETHTPTMVGNSTVISKKSMHGGHVTKLFTVWRWPNLQLLDIRLQSMQFRSYFLGH